MFDWLTGRKKKEEEFLRSMMKAMAEGERRSQVKSAVASIGPTVTDEDDTKFAAEAASELTKWLINSAPNDVSEEDINFVAGIFACCAANHFSHLVGGQFELSTSLALISVYGAPPNFAERHSQIIGSYNSMSAERSKIILAIGQTISEWTTTPSEDNRDKLSKLFDIVVRNSSSS